MDIYQVIITLDLDRILQCGGEASTVYLKDLLDVPRPTFASVEAAIVYCEKDCDILKDYMDGTTLVHSSPDWQTMSDDRTEGALRGWHATILRTRLQ